MLEVKVEQCAGIDVGKKIIEVCVLIGPANRKPAGGGSAIRKQGWRLRSIAGMAEGESLYRGRHGEHRIVLETGIQHFGRTVQGDPR